MCNGGADPLSHIIPRSAATLRRWQTLGKPLDFEPSATEPA